MAGMGLSLVTPFLPLYIDTLGNFNQATLSFWSGATIAVPFLMTAIVSPLWGRLADRSGRKLMLLRAAAGMAVIMLLTGFVTNVYELLALRFLFGMFSGFISNATALIASQVPKKESGRVLGTLNTAGIGGMLLGPVFGGVAATFLGYAHVFILTGIILGLVFLFSLWRVKEDFTPVPRAEMQGWRELLANLKNRRLVIGMLGVTLLVALMANTVNPVLSLFVREILPAGGNVELWAGAAAAAPGLTTMLLGARLGALGDRIGTHKIMLGGLVVAAVVFIPMFFVNQVWQLIALRLGLGVGMAVLLPGAQTLLTRNTPQKAISRIFAYNQSAQAMGSVFGPLIGAAVGGMLDFHYVFLAAFAFALLNFFVTLFSSREPAPAAGGGGGGGGSGGGEG